MRGYSSEATHVGRSRAISHPLDCVAEGGRPRCGPEALGALLRGSRPAGARRLRGVNRAAADEEDAALSAFDSFCRGAASHRYPRLDDRDDLWRLLVVITERKASDQARRQGRLKRGGGRILGTSESADGDLEGGGVAGVAASEPTPEFAAMVADECRRPARAAPR